MTGEVMIPVNGAPESARSLPTALRLARVLDAGVRLVRVFDVSYDALSTRAGMLDAAAAGAELRGEMERALEALAERARSIGVAACGEVLDGDDVARVLADRARATEAAAIVMMTHARGAVGRALLGSVADQVMRAAACPVVLVPPPAGEAPRGELAVERPLRHVLVPLDGSQSDATLTERLLAIPGRHELLLTLFRAVGPAVLVRRGADGAPDVDAPPPDPVRAEHDALDALARRLAAEGISARAVTAESAEPARAIVAAARDEGADLIAMTTHGRGGLRRIAYGSVADHVVRTSPVPVLLLARDDA